MPACTMQSCTPARIASLVTVEPEMASTPSEVPAASPEGLVVIDAASTALTGGKRLRARFCETGWRAVAPHERGAAVLDVAAAKAFGPDAPRGAHAAFTSVAKDAHALFRRYRQVVKR